MSTKFKKIESTDKITTIIKTVSDMDLDVDGLWGYSMESATIINSHNDFKLNDFEILLCSLRSHIQMSMTLSEEDRYTSIAPSQISKEKIEQNQKVYDKVIYSISATKESEFKELIQEYKKNHGDDTFDLAKHFKKREDCKITIEEEYWFDITNII